MVIYFSVVYGLVVGSFLTVVVDRAVFLRSNPFQNLQIAKLGFCTSRDGEPHSFVVDKRASGCLYCVEIGI